jgi:hypothetical protein
MRLRSTLALAVLLAALCAAYWGMQHLNLRRAATAQQAKQLFQFKPEAVRGLTIHQVNGVPVAAERDAGGGWRITEPNPTIRPLQLLWNRVAEKFAALNNERTVSDKPGDLKQYGLDVPQLSVEARVDGVAPVKIFVGDVEPTQRYRYARLGDGPLFLLSTDSFFELNRALDDLRHRFAVDDRDANINEVQFAWIWTGDLPSDRPVPQSPPAVGEESTLIRVVRDNPKSPWRMVAPVEAAADQEAVDALVKEVQFATGRNFVDKPESLSDYGLKPARARITVVDDRGGKAQTILIGRLEEKGDKGGLYVQHVGQDAVFQIDGQLWTLLPKSPLQWRERRLLTRRVSDVSRIEFRGKDDSFTLGKDEKGEWRLEAPALQDVNQFAVSGYLAMFKELKGESFAVGQPAEFGLDTPETTIDLRYEDGNTAQIRTVPSAKEPGLYYATQDTGAVVTLKGVAADALLAKSESFRSRELLRFNKADATRMEFQFENLGMVIEKRDGQWVIVAPATMHLANQSDAEAILTAICPLKATRAESDAAPQAPEKYGFAKPVFSIYVTVHSSGAAADTRYGQLRIGGVAPDNSQERFAMVDGKTGVFRVGQEVVQNIREALRGFQRSEDVPAGK